MCADTLPGGHIPHRNSRTRSDYENPVMEASADCRLCCCPRAREDSAAGCVEQRRTLVAAHRKQPIPARTKLHRSEARDTVAQPAGFQVDHRDVIRSALGVSDDSGGFRTEIECRKRQRDHPLGELSSVRAANPDGRGIAPDNGFPRHDASNPARRTRSDLASCRKRERTKAPVRVDHEHRPAEAELQLVRSHQVIGHGWSLAVDLRPDRLRAARSPRVRVATIGRREPRHLAPPPGSCWSAASSGVDLGASTGPPPGVTRVGLWWRRKRVPP